MLLFRSIGLDVRGLSAFRFFAGLWIAYDAWTRLFSVQTWLSDEGLVPRVLAVSERSWLFSLFFLSGGTFVNGVLLLLTVFCALCFAFGWRTRLFGWLTWFLLCNFQLRDVYFGHAGDALLRSLLFFANWLPLASAFSVDWGIHIFHTLQQDAVEAPHSSSKKKAATNERPVADAAALGFLVQLACFLVFGALAKLANNEWTSECSAITNLLQWSPYVTALGSVWSALLPSSLLCLLSRAAVNGSWMVGLALFVPVTKVRLGVCLALMSSSLLAGTALRLESLFWTPLFASVALIPSHVWNGLHRLARKSSTPLILHVHLDRWMASRLLFVFHTFLLSEASIKWEALDEQYSGHHWITVSSRADGEMHHDVGALQKLLQASFVPGMSYLSLVAGWFSSTINRFALLFNVFRESNSFLMYKPETEQLPSSVTDDSLDRPLFEGWSKYARLALMTLCILSVLSFNLTQTKVRFIF
jgi:hypothetical protein